MRSTYAARRQPAQRIDAAISREFAIFGNTPDQLAIVWSGDEAVAASPSGGPGGSYTVDVARFPADFNLGATLEMRRRNQLGLPQLSQRTVLATAAPNFAERTRILALDGERLAYDEDTLAEWLVNAEEQMLLGTDNHPIFETSLEDTVSAVGRLPNGHVTLTETPREYLNAVRDRMRSLLSGAGGAMNFIVETPVRCAARFFLARLPEGAEVRRPGRDAEVTAFLLISRAGFSIGLWAAKAGLFSEYSFLGQQELSGTDASDARLDAYVRQALDQLFLQLSPDRLDALQLSSYAKIVWACEPGLEDRVAPVSNEYSEKSGIEFFRIPIPADEAIANGLLLGSFSFGDPEAIGPRVIPVVNLARDLLVHADTEEVERRTLEQIEATKRRNRTIFAILAAPIVAFALLTAFAADIIREGIYLAYREANANAETARLKPALDRRKSYEANLVWYQEFVKQVSLLRKQQPVGTSLLYQLDSNYPLNIDPSFYISEMRLNPTGDMEIRGLARNKDAIAAFLRSLEFAGGAESGSRLFGNLAYEVQEGVPQQANVQRQDLPQIPGSTLKTPNVAPGVVAWSLKGVYLPVAAIVPPEPEKKPGAKGNPPKGQSSATKPPANAQSSPPAAQ